MRILMMIAAMLVLAGSARAQTFLATDGDAPQFATVIAEQQMATLVHHRSNGRLHILVAPDNQSSERLKLHQVRTNAVAMTRVNIAALIDAVPSMALLALPYLFRSMAQQRLVLDGPIGAELLDDLDHIGLIGLCFYALGPRSFYSVKRAIRSPADLAGLKVRTPQSVFWAAMIEEMGGKAIPFPSSRLHGLIATKLVDAAETDLLTFSSGRLYEVAKAYSLTEHSFAPDVLVFSKDLWTRLSLADQGILKAAARESAANLWAAWESHEQIARGLLARGGVDLVSDVDRAAFARKTAGFRTAYSADARSRKWLAEIVSSQGPR